MLEPLLRCNLACAGCGKIDHPDEILNRRLSVDECLAAVDESGVPVVSIAGGEPLIHKDIARIVEGIVERKKFVYLCTNALLLEKKLHEFTPSPYLTFSVHLDGLRDRHDTSVCRKGVFDKAVEAIRAALDKGFRVTANCTLFQGETAPEVAEFLDYCKELGVEGVTISPGYSYSHAPQQEIFLRRTAAKRLFRDVFRLGRGRKWRFNQSSLYLDFLAGNQAYQCTPWGNPTRNVFGWQKPCYLLVDEGYAKSFSELMETTDWDAYGTGRNPKCADCMVHCGYEPTAVNDAVMNPLKALTVALRGPRTAGDPPHA
jgi:hopanoid biosynthesis associated radical SAM protein HpnH